MTTEQRFRAAVKVIRNLPKNGSYQPSNELLLDFYAFFKQATDGEKRGGRPPFWEPVNRAKWDAWNRLGSLPKEEAMEKYVALLNKVTEKIIETMALTDSVAEFLQSMDSYPGDPDDIELSIGPLLQKFRSQPGSPIGSQETTPSRKGDSLPCTPPHISDVDEEEEEDDEFVDTLPDAETLTRTSVREEHVAVKRKDTPMVMPSASRNYQPVNQLPNGYANHKPSPAKGNDAVNEALQKAIESLRRDLTLANEKVKALEEKQNKASKNKNTKTPMMKLHCYISRFEYPYPGVAIY
ncbi:hypothetical protein GE061_017853 [Apolygus lucorum]|uniref:Uncharacterized protein n=1 Tax=Apolygus lucorum TaxID=248454 RepID=A0A6A4J7J6_APOLU|nr:hypothetical protein GE061_017853 [Apolygus lucorum]